MNGKNYASGELEPETATSVGQRLATELPGLQVKQKGFSHYDYLDQGLSVDSISLSGQEFLEQNARNTDQTAQTKRLF